ncbi:hypothetical protein BBOR36S_01449 [Brevibacillus borstelensis]
MSKKPVIGILTWREGKRFGEPGYLRRLVTAGKRMGAETFLFSHQDVNTAEKKIRGFVPAKGGGWESRLFPWPEVVIDRVPKKGRRVHAAASWRGVSVCQQSVWKEMEGD